MMQSGDVQQLIGRQEHPTQPQGWSSTLKHRGPQPPQIKEEKVELWIAQKEERFPAKEEADVAMTLPLTVVSLATEDKPNSTISLHHSLCLCPADVQLLVGRQEGLGHQPQAGSSTSEQEEPHVKEEVEDPQPLCVKKEEELWTPQEGEHLLGQGGADITKLPLIVASVKTEDKPPDFSQLRADGDRCGASKADIINENMDSQRREKPFSCSVCDKRFTRRNRFHLHMGTHHSCSDCGKSFSRKLASTSADEDGISGNSRRPNFSHEETDVLVREVQARSTRIYGTATRPPRADDAKSAWQEVANIVNEVCPDILRTAAQCKKRFNDVRRRAKKKLTGQSSHMVATGCGPSSRLTISSAEDIASTTLPMISVEGFGGVEGGITDETEQQEKGEEEEEEVLGDPVTEEVGDPGTEEVEGAGRQRLTGHRDVRCGQRQPPVQIQDQPFLDIQQGGFEMLEKQLGTLNARLQGVETRLGGLEGHLSSIDSSLIRLADAAERLIAQGASTTPAGRRWPVRPRTRVGRHSSGSPLPSPNSISSLRRGGRRVV
uniref:uncharacterized protein LOC131128100 isoform X2 n=1 Tax=Doryrhamphus excisus TaxID=161450 RepID=UPI0025ADBC5B|nr:uncharacterized protein LOC131128100 isoform X2 [Doryrhamphus excisus]